MTEQNLTGADETAEDTEGHGRFRSDETADDTEGHRWAADGSEDDDDTEGHTRH